MPKMRVHELAKLLDKSSKEIIAELKQQGVEVQSHMSTVSDEHVDKLKAKFQKKESGNNRGNNESRSNDNRGSRNDNRGDRNNNRNDNRGDGRNNNRNNDNRNGRNENRGDGRNNNRNDNRGGRNNRNANRNDNRGGGRNNNRNNDNRGGRNDIRGDNRNNNRNGNDRRNRPSMGDTPINAKETRNGKEKSFKIDPNYKTYLFGFSYGTNEKAAAEVSSVTEGKPFEKAGFKAGDIIKEVNGKKIVNAGELSTAMNEVNSDGKEVTFLVDRKGEEKTFKVTPEPYSTKTLGFIASMDEKSKSTFDVVKYSFVEVKYWIETTVGSLGALITGNVSIKNVSGPVGIVDTVGDAINQSKSYGFKVVMLQILYMSVLLSANLGVMNLLPLPALDGGRIVFILIEAIRGKPVDKEKEGFVHFAGFVVLMLIMVFVMYNDIIKILH